MENKKTKTKKRKAKREREGENSPNEGGEREETYSGVCMFLFSLEAKQNGWIKYGVTQMSAHKCGADGG